MGVLHRRQGDAALVADQVVRCDPDGAEIMPAVRIADLGGDRIQFGDGLPARGLVHPFDTGQAFAEGQAEELHQRVDGGLRFLPEVAFCIQLAQLLDRRAEKIQRRLSNWPLLLDACQGPRNGNRVSRLPTRQREGRRDCQENGRPCRRAAFRHRRAGEKRRQTLDRGVGGEVDFPVLSVKPASLRKVAQSKPGAYRARAFSVMA